MSSRVSPWFLGPPGRHPGGWFSRRIGDHPPGADDRASCSWCSAGWAVSLCLHEFGHAYTAYRGGDRSVRAKGYLTLDIRRYADLGLSLVLPVFFLLLGGIPLPGGAVWIDQRRDSVTSRAQPRLPGRARGEPRARRAPDDGGRVRADARRARGGALRAGADPGARVRAQHPAGARPRRLRRARAVPAVLGAPDGRADPAVGADRAVRADPRGAGRVVGAVLAAARWCSRRSAATRIWPLRATARCSSGGADHRGERGFVARQARPPATSADPPTRR